MITFDYPLGLLLLLLIPLLFFFVRSRSIPRPRIMTALFLLDEMKTQEPAKTFRLFRLKKKYRQSLVALIITGLAFAVSGTALQFERDLPEKWLVIIDNHPLGRRVFDGRTVQEAIHDFLLKMEGSFGEEDSVTVLTTSPSPAVRTFPAGDDLREYLDAITTARGFVDLGEAAAVAVDLAGKCSRSILLTPRSGAWRRMLSGMKSHEEIVIPADRLSVSGNAGIVNARMRPSGGEGKHDVFLAVMSSDIDAREVALSAAVEGGRPLPFPRSVPMEKGRGTLFVEGVPLEGGEVTFALAGGDAFPPDDSFTFTAAAPAAVKISITGDSTPVFDAALGSFPLFTIVPPAESEMAVFLGDSPPRMEKPSLIVYPTRDRIGLEALEIVDTTGALLWHPDHPVSAFLPPGGLRPRRVMRYAFDDGFESIASADGVPAVLAGMRDGRRVIVWAFNPLDNELFLSPEFVILLRESTEWLTNKAGTGLDYSTGVALTREAREISLPEMGKGLFQRRGSREKSIDLVPLFLAVVLLAGLYLAVADALSEEGGS